VRCDVGMGRWILVFLIPIAACREQCLRVTVKTQLLAKPFSLDTEKNRHNNHVIRVIKPGEAIVSHRKIYGKDFLAYQVKLKDGLEGYIIYGPTILEPYECSE
jgi:hypothetical protein